MRKNNESGARYQRKHHSPEGAKTTRSHTLVCCSTRCSTPLAFSPFRRRKRRAALAGYLRCFRNPETIRATCDEYRAGASIDLIHDRADRGRKLAMPLFVLWGQRSSQGSGYDVLAVWREHAENVTGHGIGSGHFLPEEAPEETYRALHRFFAGKTG